MKIILIIFLTVLSATTPASDEICQSLAKKALALKGDNTNVYEAPPCKAMPDDLGKTIMVLGDEIVVVRTNDGQIVSHGALGTIPLGATANSIDTAPYRLTPMVRGFGVRYSAFYPHYHAGEEHQTLNMYIIEGEKIRPVMELLIVSLNTSTDECKDGTDEDGCAHSELTQESTISMAKTRHNGFADLLVKTHESFGKLISNKLTYNGSHYVGPPNLMEDPENPAQ